MNYKKAQGWLLGGFLVAAAPFVATEVTGTDYCVEGARALEGATTEDYRLFVRHLPNYEDAKNQGQFALRMAITPFPSPSDSYTPHHASLEMFALPDAENWDEMTEEHHQMHGRIVDAETGETTGISPCSVKSLWRQKTGKNLLKGMVNDADVNKRILGHDPVAYIDLFYGTKEEVMRKFSAAGDYMRELNAKRLVYGFQNPPNSNTFVAFLLERLNLPFPDNLASAKQGRAKFWLPGFVKGQFPETIAAASTPRP